MERTYEEIQEVLKTFLDSELQLLHIETDAVKLVMSKAIAGSATPVVTSINPFRSATAPVVTSSVDVEAAATSSANNAPTGADTLPRVQGMGVGATNESLVAVKAPCVGVFYRRPAPDQPAFVEIGDAVSPDDPICLIEVMKLFNTVSAQTSGRIVEICVEDAVMVEYGQTLMLIDPT